MADKALFAMSKSLPGVQMYSRDMSANYLNQFFSMFGSLVSWWNIIAGGNLVLENGMNH